jgi:hypothetical protein
LKERTKPDPRNTTSTTNLEEEEIVDAPGNDGNASLPEQFKRPNPCRKMTLMITEQMFLNQHSPQKSLDTKDALISFPANDCIAGFLLCSAPR